jgi:hypothetical protein
MGTLGNKFGRGLRLEKAMGFFTGIFEIGMRRFSVDRFTGLLGFYSAVAVLFWIGLRISCGNGSASRG